MERRKTDGRRREQKKKLKPKMKAGLEKMPRRILERAALFNLCAAAHQHDVRWRMKNYPTALKWSKKNNDVTV